MQSKSIFKSLRLYLTIPFVFLILLSGVIVSYFGYANSQRTVNETASRILDETTARVEQTLSSLLSAPHIINQANADMLDQKLISTDQTAKLMQFMYQQGKREINNGISIGTVALGTPDGYFIGGNAAENYVVLANQDTGRSIRRYEVDEKGLTNWVVTRDRPDYDARTRSWYTAAVNAGKPIWNINTSITDPTRIDADAAMPYFDSNGNFKGVLTTSISLGQISDFLRTIKVGKTGQIFVIDRNGLMVAASTQEDPNVELSETTQQLGRLPAVESTNPILKATANYLNANLPFSGISNSQSFSFDITKETYLAQVTPYSDKNGLDWLIVIVTPESDFLGDIATRNITTLIAIGFTIFLTIIIALWIAQSVVNPITDLNNAAKALTEGKWGQRIRINRNDEIGELSLSFNLMASQLSGLINGLEQRVEERTTELEESSMRAKERASQLEAIADVARIIAAIQDMGQLLPEITKLVSERFEFYHVGIFLLDQNKEYAVLRAANSSGGQKMLARNHRLRIGREGIVGYSIQQMQARIALDVGEDAVFFNNPDLPATRSELALPLIIGNEAIGALDVQSEEPGAFTNEDIEVLTTLANQVAVAIENARLFAQSQETLGELENTFHRYIRNEWRQYSTYSNLKGYRAHETGVEPITKALQENVKKEKKSSIYKVPVTLRGVNIGTVDINLGKKPEEFTQEELDIVQAAVDRVALALESARLLESSQKQAAKERTIGEMSAQIGASANLDDILRATVKELGRNIPGANVSIQVRTIEDD